MSTTRQDKLEMPYFGTLANAPKGDSIVKNEEGTYAFGIVEASQALFMCRVKAGEGPPKRFLAAVEPDISAHVSTCKQYILYIGVQKGCAEWNMPDKTEDEMQISLRNWRGISREPIQFIK